MCYLKFIVALFAAVMLAGIFVIARRRKITQTDLFLIFIVIFLSSLAGGIRIKSNEPIVGEVNWVLFWWAGIIFVLFLAVYFHWKPPSSRHETLQMLERIKKEKIWGQFTYITLSLLFCALIFFWFWR